MQTERADTLIRQVLTEGKVRPFIRSKVVRHIEAPMTQMLLGEPQVKQMAAQLARHGFTHESSMALNSKIAHHKFKRGHRLITVTRFKEPEGSRVVWSSVGLTGHGQDGRGEHYTTLTTHLRAITPRRVHEEGEARSRFITEPSLDDTPSDWAEMHNRAWISPEGEVHHLKQHPETEWLSQTHLDWAKQNQELHGVKSPIPFKIPSKMMQNGWIRTTTKNYYHVHKADDATLGRVHKHFTTHHPELRSVNVNTNDGVMLKLYKRLRDPAAEKAETDAIARDLKQESEAREYPEISMDFDEPDHRAWISPEGEVHKLEKTKPGDPGDYFPTKTHYTKASEILGQKSGWKGLPGPNQQYYDFTDLMNGNWVRKVSRTTYEAKRPRRAAKIIHQHINQHHPEVSAAVIIGPGGKQHFVSKNGEVYS